MVHYRKNIFENVLGLNLSVFGVIYVLSCLLLPIAFHFYLAKYFGAYENPEECAKFVDLPYVWWYYEMWNPKGYSDVCGYSACCPFKRLGFSKGVQYDPSLPWDIVSCMKCEAAGWKYLAGFLLGPIGIVLVILLIVWIIRRCRGKIEMVRGRYERV